MIEVEKLKPQLELARIQASSNFTISDGSNPAKLHDQTKFLGDLRAPQRTLYPQQWPHILAPGEPKLYNELTLAEFTAGYLAIVEKCPDATQKSLFLHHLADLMSLACSYQWSAVHAFHYKVLHTLELGLVKWGDSFDGFKQPFFIPTNLLPSVGSPSHEKAPEKARRGVHQRPSASQQPPRHQICDDWSWFDDCSNEACSKLHICIVCKRPDHQAKHCPKRLLAARTLRHHQADYLSRFLHHHLSTTRPQFPYLRTLLSSPRTTIPDPGLSHPSPTSSAPSLSSTPCSSNPSVPTPSRFAFPCPLI